MAAIVLKKAHFEVNTVDLSAEIQSITLNLTKEAPQSTAMGDDSHEFIADGLKDGSFDVTFRADYTSGSVDATMWAIFNGTAAVAWVIRPSTVAKSTSNPEYTGNCLLTNYTPITGSPGDLATTPSNFQVTGDVGRDAS